MKNVHDKTLQLFVPPKEKLTMINTHNTTITTKEYGRLIDFQSGCWACLIGHNHDNITNVIKEHSPSLLHTHQYFSTQHPSMLVDELVASSGLKTNYKGVFLSSGSEAVMLACNLADKISGRTKRLSFSISYHGALSELRLPRDPEYWCDLDIRGCINCSKNSCAKCSVVKKLDFRKFSALVFEAGNSSGMVLCPPEKLVEYLATNIKKAAGYIISNEVTTGFGRTGKWFGHQHYPTLIEQTTSPDFIALGKGLGNGYPISGLLVKDNISQLVENSGYYYVQSHMNDPLGCIIARKVVEVINGDGLIEKGRLAGKYISQSLSNIKDNSSSIVEIRNRGLMTIVQFHESINVQDVFSKLLQRGIFVGYSTSCNFIHLYPPLTITHEEIDHLCACLNQLIY